MVESELDSETGDPSNGRTIAPLIEREALALAASSECFVIDGEQRLEGEVEISGAKNAALPAMAASLLTADECVVDNVPDIEDVHVMVDVLRSLGATADRLNAHGWRICAAKVNTFVAPSQLVKRMRGSFLVMGPLLSRFGEAASCAPGGDVIGQRPIDVHLAGFAALGARLWQEGEDYHAEAKSLVGRKIFMDYPSHIGTENLLMAAVLAKGRTTLLNASCEPEVVDLAKMLNAMGARIQGAGTSRVEIDGVSELHGVSHRVIPDRLEAGTFAIAAAISQGAVTVKNVVCGHLESLTWKLVETGAQAHEGKDRLTVVGKRPLRGVAIQALPYPGYATDLQAALGVLLTQAEGKSMIHERVYDNRLLYTHELRKMGAQIELIMPQLAVITGPTTLTGTTVRSLDIRSGAALVLAALAARDQTTILDIYHLDRGYEGFDAKMKSLGAKIRRSRVPVS
ncbi:MAG: UDP-N-acetylglucosamine 1-carboxyvinyltransferase [Chloroflexi bacterium]|nr:UDP-N-acetylglucosamine 1-carboxyvinyltransferase [Chloroflexota bacterium]